MADYAFRLRSLSYGGQVGQSALRPLNRTGGVLLILLWPQISYRLPYYLLLRREAWENEGWRTGALPYLSKRHDLGSYSARSTRI
jgi:hypothetical protein